MLQGYIVFQLSWNSLGFGQYVHPGKLEAVMQNFTDPLQRLWGCSTELCCSAFVPLKKCWLPNCHTWMLQMGSAHSSESCSPSSVCPAESG